MKWKRLIRSALALVLVCCLICNMIIFPVSAEIQYDKLVYEVAGGIVLGGIFRGLGVGLGELTSNALNDFEQLVHDCLFGLNQDANWRDLVNLDKNTMKIMTHATEGGVLNALVPKGLVEWVHNWLFESETVALTTGTYIPAGALYDNYKFNIPVRAYKVYGAKGTTGFIDFYGVIATVPYSKEDRITPKRINADGSVSSFQISTSTATIGGVSYSIYRIAQASGYDDSWAFVPGGYYTSVGELLEAAGFAVDDVTTLYNVTVDGLAALGVDFNVAYSEWAATSQTLTDSQGLAQEYVNLGIAETLEETVALSQADIWSGVTTIKQDTTQLGGTTWVTFKNWLASLFASLQTALASIQDFFTFDADLSVYTAELTSFFPFCIPWDIYNMFTLFLAEPQAPHMEFDINFPYMDEPWHLVIDLAAWDTVAQILRSLELIAFCVGLGLFTREKFLRG